MIKIIIAFVVTSSISVILSILYIIYRLKAILGKNDMPTDNQEEPLNIYSLNKDLEPFGFAYNEEQDIFYSLMYPWQREYGYGRPYDKAAPLLAMIIDSEPIIFEYDNKLWMIEFWKGQYGMTTGAEVGIYVSNKEGHQKPIIFGSISDDELLPMSYTLKRKNKVLLIRSDLHWWLTGFKLGQFSRLKDLTMDISITFKDEGMCDAFVKALRKAGYKKKDIRSLYNTVCVTYSKPHKRQPRARNALIRHIMQKYNKHNCKIYNSFTKDYTNTLDKLNYLKKEFPFMYMQIINIGGTKQLFMRTKISKN
jgi:hypothetical protein